MLIRRLRKQVDCDQTADLFGAALRRARYAIDDCSRQRPKAIEHRDAQPKRFRDGLFDACRVWTPMRVTISHQSF